ncbi:hypothetical protein C8R43DRAFT_998268 [Mycena crocata]|nr:hypothetical protein C8R43DRAFT_998268 [Mycena crocata]
MAASQIPYEIISEILSPLLKPSDEVFSNPLEKPFVDPGYSTSSYLLVSKAWLRASTPLLYSVVILRTTAQAQALEKVFQSNKDFGLFVRKLRIEAGFGKAMHTILKLSSKITDLCFSLAIWGSDDVTGLCRGLPLINPQRVILIDPLEKPKKNKKVEALLDTLLGLIPKWDKLHTFYLPYSGNPNDEESTSIERAESIVSALVKSNSLHTLEVRAWYSFPDCLRPMVQAPSLKCIRFMRLPSALGISLFSTGLETIMEQVAGDPDSKLRALVKVQDTEPITQLDLNHFDNDSDDFDYDPNQELLSESENDTSQSPPPAAASSRTAIVINMLELEKLSKASGRTIGTLSMQNSGTKRRPPASPEALACFSNVTDLQWLSPAHFSFTKPAPGFSAFPRLQTLRIAGGSSPSVFELFSNLSLDALVSADLYSFGVAGAETFIMRHGPKLIELTASLEVLPLCKVFDVCTRLTQLTVYSEPRQAISEDFFACATPHTALAKINFHFSVTERLQRPAAKAALTNLDATCFPALKEIEFEGTKWPTSE